MFSSNAHPFDSEKAYSSFSVYTLLEHNGDYSTAAAALGKEGFGEKTLPQNTDVDISSLINSSKETKAEYADDPGAIPDDFFYIPGFINAVIDFCMATAPYPNRQLAFCGALALLSFLTGRKISDSGGVRTNIYILALASSGTGKDWPRKLNAHILNNIDAIGCLGDRFASGEGLQDMMQANLSMLYQSDEIDGILRAINQSRDGRFESMMNTLMTLYTSSDSFFPVRSKAGMKQAITINQPHLTLFGTATPKYYYEALSERMLTNGFFSRMIIVDVGQRPPCQAAKAISVIPDEILATARFWQDKARHTQAGNLSWQNPTVPAAPYQGKSKELLISFQQQTDREHRKCEAYNETAKTVWTRASENARKLSLLYACSENPQQPVITEQAVSWALKFIQHQVRRQLYMSGIYAAENDFHANCLRLKEKLRTAEDKQLLRSVLLKRMKMDRDSFNKLIDTLKEQGDVMSIQSNSETFKGTVYVLCE